MKKILLLSLFLPVLVYANQLGQQTYAAACVKCHAPEIASALKAPAAFDQSAWSARLKMAEAEAANSERYKNGYDYLLYQVKIGKGLMHHGGLCRETSEQNKNCSDEALTAAIKYMAESNSEGRS